MENIDLLVLRTVRDWRLAGKHALIATVVRTWGSSPRPIGSIMALAEDGSVVGSVSGGCIEDDLIHKYASSTESSWSCQLFSSAPSVLKYGVSADEAHRFGLPCGGTLELLLEFDPDAEALSKLVSNLESGKLMRRSIDLRNGQVGLDEVFEPAGLTFDGARLTNTYGPEYRMLLIGAGQLAEYVATMALFNGFSVYVCDPREEYRRCWSVSGASVLKDMPDDVVRAMRPDSRTCVIALTHDPKLDDLALLEALESGAFYVGAIGSRRNNNARRLRLKQHFGKKEEDLRRLHGPIGIFIGSKTPSEIAVSIMAEVLAMKNGIALPREVNVGFAKAVHVDRFSQ
jgi:xanthine dehydrogenase accessory factor